jgi:hypothetical protein
MKSLALLLIAGAVHADEILVLQPKQVHESSIALAGRERAAYYVRSSAPLKFNIHYHEGEAVTHLRDDAPADKLTDTLTAGDSREYWFMWTNDTSEPVALYFKVRKEPKRL